MYAYRREMPRLTRRGFMLGGTALLACGCATAPITGRRQFIAMSPQEELALGLRAYREVLRKEPITHDPKGTAPLRRVVARVAPVAEQAARSSDFQWLQVSEQQQDQHDNEDYAQDAAGVIAPATTVRPRW